MQISKTIDDVVVTAISLNRNIAALPGSNVVLGSLEPAKTQSTSINSLLEQVPGLYMQNGTYTTSRLIFRGIGSRSPFSTNRIRAFMNEIPLTAGDGSTTLEDIEIWGTGRIEIIKGPASSLYGPGLGGTLVFRPLIYFPYRWSGLVVSENGSFDFFKVGAHLAYSDTLYKISAGLFRNVSDGYRQNNNYERNNAIIRLQRSVNRNKLSVLLNYINLYGQIPSSVNRETFYNSPEKAAPAWLAVKGFESYKKLLGGISLNNYFNTSIENLVSIYGIITNSYESRPFNILEEKRYTAGIRNRLAITKDKLLTSAGFEIFAEKRQWGIFETDGGIKGKMEFDNNEYRYFINLFMQSEWDPDKKIKISGGINFNNTLIKTVNTFGLPETAGDKTGFQVLSPSLGISYKIGTNTYLFL